MEIIKYTLNADNKDLPKSILRSIAYMMFNKEVNKRVYTRDGKIDNPEEDNNVIIHEGITYSLSHSTGHLIFLVPSGLTLNKEKIRNVLKKELKEIYRRYEEDNYVILYNKNSSVFMNIETMTSYLSITRYIGNTIKSYDTNTSMFKWYDDRTCLCESGDACPPINRSRYYFTDFLIQSNVSLYTNSIIIDLDNVFNTECKIYPSPVTEDFTMSRLLATKDVIQYEYNRVCHIDTMLRELYGIEINYKSTLLNGPIDRGIDQKEIIIHNIFGIYEEKWENIRPLRLYKMPEKTDRIAIMFNRITNFTSSFEEEELNVKKDAKAGVALRPNDACHICYMLLYDTIYVLEFEVDYNKHICICALCLHTNYAKIKKQLENYTYSILKTIYPRTCYDLINNTDIDSRYKALLCELAYSDFTINNNVIQTQNYIGILSTHELLYKKLNVAYENKQFFIYTY